VAARRTQTTALPPKNPLRNAYFGDLHVHTSWSLDAYTGGNRVNGPDVAYRYGRGDEINGEKLRVPLDFMAVTDHDSFLGDLATCTDPSDPAFNRPVCKDIREGRTGEFMTTMNLYYTDEMRHPPGICGEEDQSACIHQAAQRWKQIERNANNFYVPGKFTTFTAYEWTGMKNASNGSWLHRNVIFKGPKIPEWGGSAVEMKHNPQRLWEWLDKACTGECEVLAIPHNTNYGLGMMLDTKNVDGSPFTKAGIIRRAKAEPLIEIHQQKGNSECQIGVGTTDEDCNFEISFPVCKPGQKVGDSTGGRCAFAGDFARNALKNGLVIDENMGANPFKYGFIGSTDTHRTSPGNTDENAGAGGIGQIGDKRVPAPPQPPNAPRPVLGYGQNPGGLAAVWAEENTRDSIFAALRRKETFGTSGTRVKVRMFGSWTYAPNLHTSSTLVADAYKNGVPMGSDLPPKSGAAKAPHFLVWAIKDPNSANLQKIQIVKGWTNHGQAEEKVYDVVCSDGIVADSKTGRCKDNGATANLADCSVTPNKGAPELKTTWIDPEFNPGERAFYYARVIENPVCRGTTKLALETKTPIPTTDPPIIQERAWASPIWYTPAR
jgi:hypothetical protein